MKHIIVIIISLISMNNILAQTECNPSSPTGSQDIAGCDIDLTKIYISPCDESVFFCYDASGNRIARWTLNCDKSPGSGGHSYDKRPPSDEGVRKDTLASLEAAVLYPNPTNGPTTLALPYEVQSVILTITDTKGAVIISKKYSGRIIQFDLSPFPAGTYRVLIVKDGLHSSKSLIKE